MRAGAPLVAPGADAAGGWWCPWPAFGISNCSSIVLFYNGLREPAIRVYYL